MNNILTTQSIKKMGARGKLPKLKLPIAKASVQPAVSPNAPKNPKDKMKIGKKTCK